MKSLAFAAAFALLASSSATPVYAAQASTTVPTSQQQCEAQGNWWVSGRCANRNCTAYGRTYTPGSTGAIIRSGPNRGRFYMCDGTTGRFVLV